MGWLQGIRQAGTSAPGFTPRVYREGGRVYTESLSGGSRTEAYEIPGVVVGYVGMDDGPWFQGKKAQTYDTEGRLTGEFDVADFNARDLGETLALGIIGAIATAGAWQAFSGAAGTAGSGGAAATSQAGPTLSKAALDGTNIFGANSIPGALDVASVASATTTAASTAATSAATTTAATTSGTLAGAGATLASTLSKGLSLAGQALGIKTALDRANTPGIVPGPTGTAPYTDYTPFPEPGLVPGISNTLLIGGALVAAGAAVFFIAKKG